MKKILLFIKQLYYFHKWEYKSSKTYNFSVDIDNNTKGEAEFTARFYACSKCGEEKLKFFQP